MSFFDSLRAISLVVCLVAFGPVARVPTVFGQSAPAKTSAKKTKIQLNTDQAKASYGIGVSIGRDLTRDGMELDLRSLVLGISDSMKGNQPRISQAEFQSAMEATQKRAQQKKARLMKAMAEKNLSEGPAFLKRFSASDGVKPLPKGMYYKVLKSGDGPSPKATDQVKTHYRGTLINGKQFDSSYDRGEPAVFPLNGVIPGWTEALQKMKVGDKWQVVIPPEMAYGKEGSPPDIGPHAVLVFEIELLAIQGANPVGKILEESLPGRGP